MPPADFAQADCHGLLLAAGQSTRMGLENKLLVEFVGKPLVRHVAETMIAAGLDDMTVVIGYQADEVAAALVGLPVHLLFNPDFAAGQGHSVAAGVSALDGAVTDALIALGDMPLISAETVKNGFRIILSDKNVKAVLINIFGGIVRCDRVANGVVQAVKELGLNVPVVVRLEGTNAEEAQKILNKSGVSIIPAVGMKDAAEKVVKSALGG